MQEYQHYYRLEGHKAVPCTREEMMGQPVHFVAKTKLPTGRVSTVFLSINHAFGKGPPTVFETMIFGGPKDGYCQRYSTWEQAEKGHMITVATLKRLPVFTLLRYWLKRLYTKLKGDSK